jgi:HSP20 family protein
MMPTAKWNPFRELEAILDAYAPTTGRRSKYDPNHQGITTADWSPVVDIKETADKYMIKAELPEVKKEDVKISINEGVLVIQGERQMEKE